MKKIIAVLCFILCTAFFSGCQEVSVETILQQAETAVQQIDVEAVVTEAVEKIDWNELEDYAKQGYDALVEHFPALKGENIKDFLKSNGLALLNSYVEDGDESMRENARKLGEIIKILNPELTDEVNSVIPE